MSSLCICRFNKSVRQVDFSGNNLTEAVTSTLVTLAQNTRFITDIKLDGNEVRITFVRTHILQNRINEDIT